MTSRRIYDRSRFWPGTTRRSIRVGVLGLDYTLPADDVVESVGRSKGYTDGRTRRIFAWGNRMLSTVVSAEESKVVEVV
jgi:hypothetical protein